MARWRAVSGVGWLVTLAVLAGPLPGGTARAAPRAQAASAR